jgi:hypothetical protein
MDRGDGGEGVPEGEPPEQQSMAPKFLCQCMAGMCKSLQHNTLQNRICFVREYPRWA